MTQTRDRRPRAPSLVRSLVGLSLIASAIMTGGCVEPIQKGAAIPAAQIDALDRPLQVLPPFTNVHPDDAVVRITGDVSCTGTLIADDRVLTAHHCVAARDRDGRALDHDKRPEQLTIELGGDLLPWGEVKVRAILAPECGYASGDGDIAILVLSRHLIGIPTATPRLESPPRIGESIEILGFGRCALTRGGIERVDRRVEPVQEVDPGHFETRASICPGDSGGPVRHRKSTEIIGVVSASVMDGDDLTLGRSLFTRVDIWPELFWAAEAVSNGTSPSELPPYGVCRGRAHPPARTP